MKGAFIMDYGYIGMGALLCFVMGILYHIASLRDKKNK